LADVTGGRLLAMANRDPRQMTAAMDRLLTALQQLASSRPAAQHEAILRL
jgi:hypothetical protein